ncbi:MAG: histidine kinase [Nocardioides sp.]|nr:histidine kinase [Nocardioides sp.]
MATDGAPRTRERSVAQQVLALQLVVVLVLVAASGALAWIDASTDAHDYATEQAVAVARSVADSPTVRDALGTTDPTPVLQPYAEDVRRDTGTDFVVVMSPDRTRFTHPDPAQIGRPFIGDLGDAPDGGVFTQQYAGTLGPSIRAVVPVLDDGTLVGLVSVGITVASIDHQVREDLRLIGLVALAVLLVGLLGSWLVGRRLRRQTHGLGEQEITRMFEYYSAVLHAVREGLLLLDREGRVALLNDEARRLLDLPDGVEGRPLADLDLAPALVDAALGRDAAPDDLYVAGDRVLLVSSSPAAWDGRAVGSVVTLRDRTELRAVSGELDVVRGLTESLRAQTHEAANRMHTVVSLIEMGRPDDAVEFATEELQLAQLLTDRLVGATTDPVVTALLLGKSAAAAERGTDLEVVGTLPGLDLHGRDLVTVVGNLVDNAVDAATGPGAAERRRVRLTLAPGPAAGEAVVRVEDSGAGMDDEEARHALETGWTTKASSSPGGRGVGLALVAQVARRHGGDVRIGRSALGGASVEVTLRDPAAGPAGTGGTP